MTSSACSAATVNALPIALSAATPAGHVLCVIATAVIAPALVAAFEHTRFRACAFNVVQLDTAGSRRTRKHHGGHSLCVISSWITTQFRVDDTCILYIVFLKKLTAKRGRQ